MLYVTLLKRINPAEKNICYLNNEQSARFSSHPKPPHDIQRSRLAAELGLLLYLPSN